MYIHLTGFGATQISSVVTMSLTNVKCTTKRVIKHNLEIIEKGFEGTHLPHILGFKCDDREAKVIREVGERFKKENIIEETYENFGLQLSFLRSKIICGDRAGTSYFKKKKLAATPALIQGGGKATMMRFGF
ncbi:hypothetical protein PHYBLDRAFT_63093 [Phycomyces blakesleeanus NRRL 1555(-)]|uniref:Uncharacterized protein n=1 Tax=Phycomyces blakesleeanus (strain ATCC 8743b / DSM 1359 / FGSC 10004 / NBRC 33097 / NRRL 1555) TaxID=763407 RepID=A0A163E547_PHYB8|nr:hypothetical protein PHYBLDRAFT_63093 [Phycomyces blakesleeanus NRRL 1555(-)]OAD76700.1 hypothetical protein PHYBLDRAFT_63093 [Phycomyces blakesleeanus NRRL 1555(-)]|eukprot:XP_018294740.1 hypothetical protein PHYBLDRAFT_63093 [Phycomyces blakesleeanus NRRL 1555(-)]